MKKNKNGLGVASKRGEGGLEGHRELTKLKGERNNRGRRAVTRAEPGPQQREQWAPSEDKLILFVPVVSAQDSNPQERDSDWPSLGYRAPPAVKGVALCVR